jgi:hypothetical protein
MTAFAYGGCRVSPPGDPSDGDPARGSPLSRRFHFDGRITNSCLSFPRSCHIVLIKDFLMAGQALVGWELALGGKVA